ncbi:MAG TPA: DUF1801 domain-containing protein [Gemmataceae bacterium]|nr:DUF1801 domain-containing protein [Gemmataceae bacterium]
MTATELQAFLADLPPEARKLILALRTVVRGVVPQAEESLVWGCISYHRREVGGRVKGAVCQLVAKHGQVRLDFIHGIRLHDPAGLLEGDGTSKRFVRIASIADAQRPEVADLIREAADLDPAEFL